MFSTVICLYPIAAFILLLSGFDLTVYYSLAVFAAVLHFFKPDQKINYSFSFSYLLLLFLCFLSLILGHEVRIVVSVIFNSTLVFFGLHLFAKENGGAKLYFYGVLLLLGFSSLQVFGFVSYTDFDYIDGSYVGRLSSVFIKPNDFASVITPLCIYFFCRFVQRKLTVLGFVLVAIFALLFFEFIGLRSYRAIVWAMMIISVFVRYNIVSVEIIDIFFRWLPFSLFALLITILWVLPDELVNFLSLRGRTSMWVAQFNELLSHPMSWFGKGTATLLHSYPFLHSSEEVHSGLLEFAIFFGVGSIVVLVFLYCASKVLSNNFSPLLSCLVSIWVLGVAITNSVVLYPSFVACLLISIVLFRSSKGC